MGPDFCLQGRNRQKPIFNFGERPDYLDPAPPLQVQSFFLNIKKRVFAMMKESSVHDDDDDDGDDDDDDDGDDDD